MLTDVEMELTEEQKKFNLKCAALKNDLDKIDQAIFTKLGEGGISKLVSNGLDTLELVQLATEEDLGECKLNVGEKRLLYNKLHPGVLLLAMPIVKDISNSRGVEPS